MNILLTTISAILIFAVLIFIHEFGHFVAAKLFGVRVNEFALGMGPKLFGKQKGETLYSLRLIPIGGYCAMEGENEVTGDDKAFSSKKPWVRLIILAAGAFMNILLGFVLVLILTFGAASFVVPSVSQVVPNGAAETAGILPGDEIVRANGKRIHIIDDFSWAMSKTDHEDMTLNLVVKNGNETRAVSVTPFMAEGKPTYGIVLNTKENSFFETFRTSFYKTGFYSGVIVESFFDLIRGRVPISQVSGPVGIVSEIGTAVEETRTLGFEGFLSLLSLTVLLTINLGVFNLLPLPALDGGRILFVLIELIFRKPVPIEKEALVHFVGLAILILLSIFIAFKDVFMLWM